MTTLGEIEAAISKLGYGTAEYHEALAFYFIILARSQWRQADLAHRKDIINVKKQSQRNRKL